MLRFSVSMYLITTFSKFSKKMRKIRFGFAFCVVIQVFSLVCGNTSQPWTYRGFEKFPSLYFAAKPMGDLSNEELDKIAIFQLAYVSTIDDSFLLSLSLSLSLSILEKSFILFTFKCLGLCTSNNSTHTHSIIEFRANQFDGEESGTKK